VEVEMINVTRFSIWDNVNLVYRKCIPKVGFPRIIEKGSKQDYEITESEASES